MRRISLWLLSTISTLVLLFSYHTSTSAKASTSIVFSAESGANSTGSTSATNSSGSSSASASGSGTGSAETSTSAGSSSGETSASSSGTASTTTSGALTYDGSVVSTRYGNVQVQITVEDGKVTKSIVLQVPWNDRKDQEINSRAVPTLNAETVQAQSADIDMVSGATYTSKGYIESLQAALDQAHLRDHHGQ